MVSPDDVPRNPFEDSSPPGTPPAIPTLPTPGFLVGVWVGNITHEVRLRTDGAAAIEMPEPGRLIYAPKDVRVREVLAFLAKRTVAGRKGGADAK